MTGKPRRYTDEDRARALEVLQADGLAAAAAAIGCSKSTVSRWAEAAGIDLAATAERSTEQKRQAAAASVAARAAKLVDRHAQLSDLLLERLAPQAAELIAERLEEDRRQAERIAEAEEHLDAAIAALAVIADVAEGADNPEEARRVAREERKGARERVLDARAVLEARRAGRVKVPELVGVLTRAVNDHLLLEGKAAEAADATPAGFTVVLSAPRPDRRHRPEPVVLEAEPERTAT